MPILQVQDEFQSGDNVTATSLNNLVEQASFDSGAVDNATLQIDTLGSGYLKVKDNGILSNHLKSDASDSNDAQRAITTNHIRNDAVTNAKIANLAVDTDQIAADAVTYAKIQNVSTTDRVLGRDSAGAGNVEEISPASLRTMINVEDGATADQTASEIKTAYESNADTNVFTDAEKTKLTGIETGATADQTASEIKTAYESNSDTNAFTDAEKTKLTGIATGAEVNVQSDWDQSTATADDFIKNKPNVQYTSAIPNATQTTEGLMSSSDKTKLDGIEAGAEVNPSNATTSASGLMSSSDKTKLDGIQAGAEVNPSDATTSASGLMSSSDKTKLDGIATSANNYSHPTGDGNLHVPATGTTNEGKILTAGATAGSLSWSTAPANEVITSSWALNVDVSLGFNGFGGTTYTGTSPDNVQNSRLFYHRCGRFAVLTGYILFYKTTSVHTRLRNTHNYSTIYLLTPEDELVTGGTARIYPEQDTSSSVGTNHFTKSAGAGYATLQGGPTNTTTSTPDYFVGNARIGEIPGLANTQNDHDILSIRIFGGQDTYARYLHFETQFLLSSDFV